VRSERAGWSGCGRPRRAVWIWALGVFLWLYAVMPSVRAQQPGPFRLYSEPFNIPERGFVLSFTALTESNRFNFIPPDRWSSRVDESARKLTLQPVSLAAGLVVQWLDVLTNGIPVGRTNYWRELALERHGGAVMVREFQAFTRSGRVDAFDLTRSAADARSVSMRIAYLPYETGVVEIALTTQADRLSKFQRVFGHLMTSFKVESWTPAPAESARNEPTARTP